MLLHRTDDLSQGGNLVLDTAVFLEYLPSKDQWLLTLMAVRTASQSFISSDGQADVL